MLIFFNWIGVGIVVVAIVLGAILGFALEGVKGLSQDAAVRIGLIVAGVLAAIGDLKLRRREYALLGLAGRAWLAPGAGGHVMFIPVWLLGALWSMLLLATALPENTERRDAALMELCQAWDTYRAGDIATARAKVEKSIDTDDGLAYAHIVRGEFAVNSQDWSTALKHLGRGIRALSRGYQPTHCPGDPPVSVDEMRGNTACLLGYVLIQLAEAASLEGRREDEQRYLRQARDRLSQGLSHATDPEMRSMARRLLAMFNE